MANTTPHDNETLFVHNAILEFMVKQKWTMCWGVVLISVVLAVIGFKQSALWYWVIWLVLTAVGLYAHIALRSVQTPLDDVMASQRLLRLNIWLEFANGVVLSLCLLAFADLSGNERLLYTLIFLAVVVGDITNTAGHQKLFWAFSGPIIVMLSLMWFVYPDPQDSALFRYLAGALILVPFTPMMYVFASSVWALFDESCRLRFRESALNAELQKALDAAEQANRSKTRFLAAASHDLRQPLHVISLVGSALQLRALDDVSSEMVNVLNKASDSLQSLLGGLLDVSKLDSNLFEPELAMVSIEDFTHDFYQSYAPLVLARGLTPRLNIDVPEACCIMTDTGLLRRVLNNLGENALKFTEKGDIYIRLTTDANDVLLEIEDTGCGIAPEHQEEIFQEFFQVNNNERDVSRGIGLGLSIVQRVAHLLKIEVTCSSKMGLGTRMCLRMPMALSTQNQLPISTQIDSHPHVAVVPVGLRVLVVDDEGSVLEASRLLLAELGCSVWTAFDLDQARACLDEMKPHRPDLMMIDFRLKNASGIDVIKALRQTLGEPWVNAVLVSGDTAPERLLLAKQEGVHICHKPLTLEKLKTELVATTTLSLRA